MRCSGNVTCPSVKNISGARVLLWKVITLRRPQDCPTRVPHFQECAKCVPQKCLTRVPYKSVRPKLCYECRTSVSPTRVSYKGALQECATSCDKNPECPTGVSDNSVPKECLTRLRYKSALQTRAAHSLQTTLQLWGLRSWPITERGEFARLAIGLCVSTA